MAISFVGGATLADANTSGATYSLSLTGLTGGSDSAPATGDLVIVVNNHALTTDTAVSVTTSGYTEVVNDFQNDNNKINVSISWKIMGGTPDTSVTVQRTNLGSSDYNGAVMAMVYRGVDSTTPIEASSYTGSINSAQINPLPVTTITNNAWVFAGGAVSADATPVLFVAPSPFTNEKSVNGGGGFKSTSMGYATYELATAGSYDPPAWTGGETSALNSYSNHTIALKPSAGGGSTGQIKAKITGTMTAKPLKAKIAGTFTTKPLKHKVAGVFVETNY